MIRRAMPGRALIALLALALALPAAADGRKELIQAFSRTQSLTSWRATMVDLASKRTVSTVEYQAPDRYRVTAAGQPPSLIIGGNMYIKAGDRHMKIPMPKKMMGQFRNDAAIEALASGGEVESLGPAMVGTTPARKYRYDSSRDGQQATSVVWVGTTHGRVLQVETSGKSAGKPFAMRMSYGDFNSKAIRIDPPA